MLNNQEPCEIGARSTTFKIQTRLVHRTVALPHCLSTNEDAEDLQDWCDK